jgi:hypothetical protein
MLELKVQCDCGQKYKFDVEPVNNRMPFTVKCPICGLDGTEKANALLQERAAAQSVSPASSSPYPPSPAPMDPAILAGAAATEQPKLRLSLSTSHASSSGDSVPATAPQTTSPAAAAIAATGGKPLSRPGIPSTFSTGSSRPAKEPDAVNLPLGIVGAVVGGFLGMMGWYLLIKWTGYEIGYAAWGVGLLAGFGARILGREGNATLGVVAAICALLAILGGQYLYSTQPAKGEIMEEAMRKLGDVMDTMGDAAYDEAVKFAQDAINAKTDDEIKALFVKINSIQPTKNELVEFKEKDLPKMRALGNGKLTKDQFLKQLKDESIETVRKWTLKDRWELFKSTIDGFTFLFLFLGVSSAYKIGAG